MSKVLALEFQKHTPWGKQKERSQGMGKMFGKLPDK